jgi:hypothetical protein
MPRKPDKCDLHSDEIRALNEGALKSHSLLEEIRSDLKWIKDDISVNGSKGLQNVLKDNYQRTEENSNSIGELKELTHNLRVNKQVRQAADAWMAAHPRLAVLMDTAGKKAFWLIIAAVGTYFGISLS